MLSTHLCACFKDKNSDPVKIIGEAWALRKLPPFSNFRACRIRHEMFRTQHLLVPVLKACLLLVMHRPEKCPMSCSRDISAFKKHDLDQLVMVCDRALVGQVSPYQLI